MLNLDVITLSWTLDELTRSPGEELYKPTDFHTRVRRAAKRFGLKEALEGEDWTLCWTDTTVPLDRLMDMRPHQKVNHFPGMIEVCRKDLLARNLNRMLKRFPKEYSFYPRTWCLPADYGDFQAFTRSKKHKTFICKPDSGSQGRGIFLARSPKDIPHGEHLICQIYISKPLIIDGYKFDLRIYVLVTSCDPFHIFVYQEGLARFCTDRYCFPAGSNMGNACMHLTNYAINKNSEHFITDEDTGSKRKLSVLLTRLLDQMSCDVAKLWLDIEDMVIKSLVSAHSVLSHNYHASFPRNPRLGTSSSGACFELLGFDVLLDHKLKPWLLEINHSPSFSTDSALDREVKDRLLYDTLVLINLPACQRRTTQTHNATHTKDKPEACQWHQDSVLRYEDRHLGGYRRIYPRQDGGEQYEQFLQHSSPLLQQTVCSRAREQCTREQLQELYERQKQRRSRVQGAGGGGGVQGESAGDRRSRSSSKTSLTLHNRNNVLPHFRSELHAVSECGPEEEGEGSGCHGLQRHNDDLIKAAHDDDIITTETLGALVEVCVGPVISGDKPPQLQTDNPHLPSSSELQPRSEPYQQPPNSPEDEPFIQLQSDRTTRALMMTDDLPPSQRRHHHHHHHHTLLLPQLQTKALLHLDLQQQSQSLRSWRTGEHLPPPPPPPPPEACCSLSAPERSWKWESSGAMKASERRVLLSIGGSLCKLSNWRNSNCPFGDWRSGGHAPWPAGGHAPWPAGSHMNQSEKHSELHVVSRPAPINRRPAHHHTASHSEAVAMTTCPAHFYLPRLPSLQNAEPASFSSSNDRPTAGGANETPMQKAEPGGGARNRNRKEKWDGANNARCQIIDPAVMVELH